MRWDGQFQENDNFKKAAGYGNIMDNLLTKHKNNATRRANNSRIYAYILQTLETLKDTDTMLHSLLYLLEQNMFVGSLNTLKERQLISGNFDESTLLQLCNNSWLELKVGERFRVVPNKFQIVNENDEELMKLGYTNNNPSKPNVTLLYFTDQGEQQIEKLVNFLPVLLFEIVTNEISVCQQKIEFLNWNLLESNIKSLLQTIYGTTQVTSIQNLKQRLVSLQEDLGFYKLNKPGIDYFSHLTEKTTMLVFSIKGGGDEIDYENIETWMTGYIITDTKQLIYNIQKQTPDIDKYPWIYATRNESVFTEENHLKLELICRRKLKPDLQGIGFSLMSYFLSHFRHYYANISMVLMDVARTHGDQGLPDPMFAQLLHERFKFQRTFEFEPLLESPFVMALAPAERDTTLNNLNFIFSTQQHAPYLKHYENNNNFSAAVLLREFNNVSENDVDLNNLEDPNVQKILSTGTKTLTFARPMPTVEDLDSIYQRFYQSLTEKKRRVPIGRLENY